jgi:LmbE family N-acetylglucosaminyl deacetylase
VRSPRAGLRNSLARRFRDRPEVFGEAALRASAVIFAPHADDETLACGGTIAKKVAAGAVVTIAIVTDGGASHAGAARDELVASRRYEAVEAARAVGVDASHVRFLEFEDGGLARAGGALEDAVASLLATLRPEQVFVPWRHDGHPDHEATFTAAVAGARGAGLACEVFEYPIWAWRHYPWVNLRWPRGDELPPWRATAKFAAGWRFPRIFRDTSHIGEAAEAKRNALGCYRSQLDAAGEWSLRSVSRGEFLQAFDLPFEVFRRSRLRG